jgi:aspartate racemase
LKEASKAVSDGRIGLLATDGTLQSGIYDKRAVDHGLKLIHPKPEEQAKIMKFIYSIKGGDLKGHSEGFQEVVTRMADEGLKAVILGCTELSVAIDYIELDKRITYLDPLTIIARKALFESGCVAK